MMKTVTLNDTANDWVDDILVHHRFQPFWWVRQVSTESQQALMRHHLLQLQQDETAVILGVYTKDTPDLTGFAAMQPLAWDTAHFGIDIWRLLYFGIWAKSARQPEAACVLAETVKREAFRRSAQTIHVWMPLDAIQTIHALESVGFRTMESQVYWLFDINRQPIPPQITNASFRPHRPDDTEALISLARRVYTPIPDRFHADPHLPTDLCDELYASWLRNSCSGEAADYISVIDVAGEVVGYGTLRYLNDQNGQCNKRLGQFILGAIDPEHRQRGLYDDMMRSLLVWLNDQQADIAIVGTQTNNIATQTGLVRMGWRPVCSALSLHLWRGR